jgi:hypothetical protein
VARCRYCGQTVKWIASDAGPELYDFTGEPHNCRSASKPREITTKSEDAVCAKCWKPIAGGRDTCTCLSPQYVSKIEADKLRAEQASKKKKEERSVEKHAQQLFKCRICGKDAVRAGDVVICSENPDHSFPSSYYDDLEGA